MKDTFWRSGQQEAESENKEILIHEPAILKQINNRIYFYSEIGRADILQLNQVIREQSNSLIFNAQTEGRKEVSPIFIHLNSYGGSIFHGLAAMDEILNCGVNVITIIDGCCASAATFLSIVGSKRYINRHAFMLIHQLSSFMWGKYTEFQDEMKNLDKLMNTIKDIYKEYTKIPIDKLEEILNHDIWFNAEECIEYSLVDEIL